jgi:hypothetical protein
MARRQGPKSGCNTLRGHHTPSVLQPLFLLGTRGQRIRESGDTGDTCPRPVSPPDHRVFPAQDRTGDSGDSGDTFCHLAAASSSTARPVEAGALVDLAASASGGFEPAELVTQDEREDSQASGP